ncbi:hypothetical protein IMZ48_45645, partial [Candidatus Bathyarchaeota archaeon]|nr:hypothetical protein [Candidatus Bathyarchaeota archaeon]
MSSKRKAPSRIAAPVVKPSAKPATRTAVDEKHADVAGAETSAAALSKPAMIEISSDSDSDSEEDAEDEEMGDAGPEEDAQEKDDSEEVAEPSSKRVNGGSARQDDADAATEGTESDSEVSPSFGDLLRSQQTIDVEASLSTAHDAGALVPSGGRSLAAPSASSLGTVLN